jgi:hypothetical protein
MRAPDLTTPPFCPGEEVKLVAGTYQGTVGTFLGSHPDPKWADIQEPDGSVRAHPVEWLDRCGARSSRLPQAVA